MFFFLSPYSVSAILFLVLFGLLKLQNSLTAGLDGTTQKQATADMVKTLLILFSATVVLSKSGLINTSAQVLEAVFFQEYVIPLCLQHHGSSDLCSTKVWNVTARCV